MPLEVVDKLKGQEKKWKKFIKHIDSDIDCLHCKYTEREKSIPNKEFKIKNIKGADVTVKKITIMYGRHDDVVGWTF